MALLHLLSPCYFSAFSMYGWRLLVNSLFFSLAFSFFLTPKSCLIIGCFTCYYANHKENIFTKYKGIFHNKKILMLLCFLLMYLQNKFNYKQKCIFKTQSLKTKLTSVLQRLKWRQIKKKQFGESRLLYFKICDRILKIKIK